MTLHGDLAGDHPPLEFGGWWACEHPERPADDSCAFWHACEACRLAFAATARLDPGSMTTVLEGSPCGLPPGRHHTFDAAVALARATRDQRMAAALGMD